MVEERGHTHARGEEAQFTGIPFTLGVRLLYVYLKSTLELWCHSNKDGESKKLLEKWACVEKKRMEKNE